MTDKADDAACVPVIRERLYTRGNGPSHRKCPCIQFTAKHPITGTTLARTQVGLTRTDAELLEAYAAFYSRALAMMEAQDQESTYIEWDR